VRLRVIREEDRVLCNAGLLISNIDNDINSIDDTFGVSIGIDNTFRLGYRKKYRRYFNAVFADISISILLS